MNTLVVVGSARCLWDDLSQVPGHFPVMGVNMAGLHAQTIGLIAQLRWTLENGDPCLPEVHSIEAAPGVTRVWPEGKKECGTSGLFAARVALKLGYKRVILAGIPLDSTGHFYLPLWQNYPIGEGGDKDCWVKALPELVGRVVSCSGWTRTLLGGL